MKEEEGRTEGRKGTGDKREGEEEKKGGRGIGCAIISDLKKGAIQAITFLDLPG